MNELNRVQLKSIKRRIKITVYILPFLNINWLVVVNLNDMQKCEY